MNKSNPDRWIRLAKIIYEQDPAASSWQEVYDLYPSIKALQAHETAHRLYLEGEKYLARQISEQARQLTGIEIHPGAQLGEVVFIDHGMGLVIGETAIVGEYVKLYHNVTLGGTGKEKGVKRHPTIEDHVEIGTGATILGDVTIGHHSKVGAGAVVLQDVPPYATAVGVPAKIILHSAE
ncbi:serine O-acetyltransferase EpsC [Hutsoniella sourekii]|uniref:serine O-acetyltransferase EpsC n=1 Tax=Hutsoniella sourekii TaxID=87650 RepID=UPI000482472C|nr:serine O-acetyltransferase EpsC [Hutsoniella sourekii]